MSSKFRISCYKEAIYKRVLLLLMMLEIAASKALKFLIHKILAQK